MAGQAEIVIRFSDRDPELTRKIASMINQAVHGEEASDAWGLSDGQMLEIKLEMTDGQGQPYPITRCW